MNEWLIRQGVESPQTALILGLLVGLLVAVAAAWGASRRSARLERLGLRPEIDDLAARLEESRAALGAAEQERTVLETRVEDREQQARLARAIRAHDGVHLARIHGERETAQYVIARDAGFQVLDFEHVYS